MSRRFSGVDTLKGLRFFSDEGRALVEARLNGSRTINIYVVGFVEGMSE